MSTRTFSLFFLYDTATTEIYTLSLHDALPIFALGDFPDLPRKILKAFHKIVAGVPAVYGDRSEEHTSELQSHSDLVCRLLLEKKKKQPKTRVEYKTRNTYTSRVPI